MDAEFIEVSGIALNLARVEFIDCRDRTVIVRFASGAEKLFTGEDAANLTRLFSSEEPKCNVTEMPKRLAS